LEQSYSSTHSSFQRYFDISGKLHSPTALPLGKNAAGNSTRVSVTAEVGVDGFEKEKFLPLPSFEPRTVHPTHNHRTHYATQLFQCEKCK
jgi:hypothetical protein